MSLIPLTLPSLPLPLYPSPLSYTCYPPHVCPLQGMELFVNGEPMTLARWPNVNMDPGNGTNLAWARTKSAAACKKTHSLLDAAEDEDEGEEEEDDEDEEGKTGLSSSAWLRRRRRQRRRQGHSNVNASSPSPSPSLPFNSSAPLTTKNTFCFSESAPWAKWIDTTDLWVHATWANEWNDLTNKIATINKKGFSATIQKPYNPDGPIDTAK